MYTTPAFIAVVIAVANFVALLTLFRLHTVDDAEPISVAVNRHDDDVEEEVCSAPAQKNTLEKGAPDHLAVAVSMYLFFNVCFMFTIFETIGTPLVMDMYGWSRPTAALYVGIMLAGGAILAVAVYIAVKTLSHWGFDERKLLIGGFVVCLVSYGVYLPWGNKMPVMGYAPVYTPLPSRSTTPMPRVIPDATVVLPWQQDRQPAWQQEGKPLSHRLQNDVSVVFQSVSPVLHESGPHHHTRRSSSPRQRPGVISRDVANVASSGSSGKVNPRLNRTGSWADLTHSKSRADSKAAPITAMATTTAAAAAAVAVETTPSGSTPNTTAYAEGCPWKFGWCGDVPRVRLFQFILGTVFIAIGYPVVNVMTYSLFSKVLGPQPQGLWMGFLTACGSLARTLGPIFVAQVYDAWGPRVTFACTCGILAVTVAINCAAFRRLVPFAASPYRKRRSPSSASDDGSVDILPTTGTLQ